MRDGTKFLKKNMTWKSELSIFPHQLQVQEIEKQKKKIVHVSNFFTSMTT